MSVYEATIVNTDATASVIACVRRIADLSIADIRQRIADGVPLIEWDSDDYPLDGDREAIHGQILSDIESLRSAGCTLQLQYRPAPGDVPESVTYDQMLNLMQSDVDFDNSEHI